MALALGSAVDRKMSSVRVLALPPVCHDIFLRAGRQEKKDEKSAERSPMWAMRQAGRYLPEFMALRSFSFLERCHTPELAAEVTLQPLRRYMKQLDAVVIFSDILIVPPAMGLPVVFTPGPKFTRLLNGPEDLDTLNFNPDIETSFGFLLDAITLTRRMAAAPKGEAFDVDAAMKRTYADGIVGRADAEDQYRLPRSALPAALVGDIQSGAACCGKAVPVIGFVGAPWTLMSYCIDGDAVEAVAPAAAAAPHENPSASSAAAPAPAGGAATAKPGERGLVGHKTYEKSKRWLYYVSLKNTNTLYQSRRRRRDTTCILFVSFLQHPEASHRLLSGITNILIDLLVAQWKAGADILQLFETNAEALPPARFNEFALPYLLKIATEVRRRTAPLNEGGPILSLFAKGAHYALETFGDPVSSHYDVISLDWSMDPATAVKVVNEAANRANEKARKEGSDVVYNAKALQGNLDPCELFGSAETIRAAAFQMLDGFKGHPHIANLGHGMLPGHKPEALQAYFDAVMDYPSYSAARAADAASEGR
jgi:uroporphyrinogen-III decarboxylase